MLIVGLTGGIGVGKSTVAGLLGDRGAVVIDVDGLGRDVISPGGGAVDAVVERFGPDVRSADGGIDRAALAGIVFGSPDELKALEAISHPAINNLLDERVEALSAAGPEVFESVDGPVVVFDMAVLVESSLGFGTRFPYELVVTVESPLDVRLDRLEERGTTREDAAARIESQATDEERRAVAQFIVGNGGGLDVLNTAVDELWAELQRLHAVKYA
ncbi:MAG: dephospho-CoA kinase [Actinomycetota bacterium]|nr:dephospho-CoA kinase [Actinomycetota bacterium]